MSAESQEGAPGERLLVVEDDRYLREEILRVLERRTSYAVSAAADGEEALELAGRERFDLLITDVRMPGIDGIELLERLKERQPGLASIIITAFADEQATIRALKIGANDYIRKPFSIRDLVNAIDRQVTVQRLRREADRSRRMMEGIVQSVRAGVLAIDAGDRLAAVNRRALEILHLGEEELIGRDARELLQDHDSEGAEEVIALLDELKSKQAPGLDRELTVRQAGLPITYRLSGTIVHDGEGNRLGIVILFNDVSELIQSQKLNAWKDLARTVAHEIKNPLTPIKLSAQQLRSARDAGAQVLARQFDPAVDSIIRNADRLNALAQEFSRFGRLPEREMEPVDLHTVLEEAIETHSPRRSNVEIAADFAPELPRISGDREALLRMTGNLIANAFDAMPDGGTLTIATGRHGDGRVLLRVGDTGEGISEEVRGSLFKPYVTSKAGGTGLGLVVVKEVVSRHDGQIEVESGPERGTTFVILFPALA